MITSTEFTDRINDALERLGLADDYSAGVPGWNDLGQAHITGDSIAGEPIDVLCSAEYLAEKLEEVESLTAYDFEELLTEITAD